MASHDLVGFATIIVVAIYHTERCIQRIFGTQHRMYGPPRFLSTCGSLHLFWCKQRVELLEYIGCIAICCNAIENAGPKVFFYVFSDNEHNLTESTLQCIVG